MISQNGESDLKNKWLVYVLQCRDCSLYTGITNDLARRLEAHAAGTASKYTRTRLPAKVVFRERMRTKSQALRRELEIKKLTRAQKILLVSAK